MYYLWCIGLSLSLNVWLVFYSGYSGTLNKSLHKAHCGWQTMSILILTHI